MRLQSGVKIRGLFASQVDSILVEHEAEGMCPRQFKVKSEPHRFVARFGSYDDEIYASAKGTQFPLISNSCTTGHKLQGCSVDAIYVNDWFYGVN